MKTAEVKLSGSGFSLAFVVGVVFVVLKFVGVITWSWWWVLAPFWIPIALLLAVGVIIVLIVLLYRVFSRK